MIALTKVLQEAQKTTTNAYGHVIGPDGNPVVSYAPNPNHAGYLPVNPQTYAGAVQAINAQNTPVTSAPQVVTVAPQAPITPMVPVAASTHQLIPQAAATTHVQPKNFAGIPQKVARKVTKTVTQQNPTMSAAPVQTTNPVIQDLTRKVKSGVGTEQGYQDAVRLNAARRAMNVQTVQPQVAPIQQNPTMPIAQVPVAQPPIVQPVPVQPVQAADMSGSEAAGVAMKKGAHAAGEAVGSLGKKTMELAGEHPVMAGAVGALGAAAGLKRILRGGNKPKE